MASLIPGYEYDIFISYRQKDNLPTPGSGRQGRGERWVSEFVEALKTELESTFKEEISVRYDAAVIAYRKALDLNPSQGVAGNIIGALHSAGREGEEVEMQKKRWKDDPRFQDLARKMNLPYFSGYRPRVE